MVHNLGMGKVELKTPNLGRNMGAPLDLDWVASVRVNKSATERRTKSLPGRRTVKKQWQAAWLVRAIECMDLTTLGGDDTPGNVHRLCAKARMPLKSELAEALGVKNIRVGAVCVYHELVPYAVNALEGTGIPVAAVAAGFPHGLSPMKQRIEEIEESVAAGAQEIDIVITRSKVLLGQWESLFEEVQAFREACGEAHLKTILATGELGTLSNVGKASLVCMMAGADFIKTSTGKESVNATLEYGLVMARAIREYQEQTGFQVGYKPAGGIRTAKQAMEWLILMREELGQPWLKPDLFRLGASSLLSDIERQLDHFVTGRYSALNRNPMA
ncbi:MAG: deoxyribose-phosphate aldolase [Fimbriimonadaceae bacterium]